MLTDTDAEWDTLADGVTATLWDVDGVMLMLLTAMEFDVKLTSRDVDCFATNIHSMINNFKSPTDFHYDFFSLNYHYYY